MLSSKPEVWKETPHTTIFLLIIMAPPALIKAFREVGVCSGKGWGWNLEAEGISSAEGQSPGEMEGPVKAAELGEN